MTDVTRPTLADDSGDFDDGTVIDADLINDIFDQIDDQVSSASNTQKPKATTDEVITARAAFSSLDARLDDIEGDITTLSNVASVEAAIGQGSWVQNDDFRVWCAGDSAAPTAWTLAGAGASVARAGTGLGDTTRKIGDYCAKVTRAGADVTLSQTLLSANGIGRADFLKGKYFAIGCWVKSSTGSHARIQITDGSTTSQSSYHTGGGAWEFLVVTYTVSNSASSLSVKCEVNNSNAAAYFSGFSAVPVYNSTIELQNYVPCPTVEKVFSFTIAGNCATGLKVRVPTYRLGIVRDVQLSCLTPPGGSALVCDVNTWDSAAFTSMFSTRPQIGVGANYGAAQPDSTYARRGYRGFSGTTPTNAGETFTVDIDTDDGGNLATDLTFTVRATEYSRPQERYTDSSDF